MLKSHLAKFALMVALALGMTTDADALLVSYVGSNGLSATADYSLLDSGNKLQVVLSNTSTSPFGNANGSADMVLSSLNFNLGGAAISGGTVAITAGSQAVVSTNTSAWAANGASYNLGSEYGFSNTGVGNSGGGLTPQLLLALNSITSHNNGGNAVTTFNGASGVNGNGLNWGLVPVGSNDIGNNREFIQNSVTLVLNLTSSLTDLSFLQLGSYVEFGSDAFYVPNQPLDPEDPTVPEPATLGLVGLGMGLAGVARRRRNAAS